MIYYIIDYGDILSDIIPEMIVLYVIHSKFWHFGVRVMIAS